MKTKIYLHGHLAERHPAPIEVDVETVAEALEFLGTLSFMQPEHGSPFPIEIDGVTTQQALYSRDYLQEIHIHPRLGGGGGKGGLMQILIGVALIAVAGPLAGSAFGATLGLTASSLATTGLLMAVGGLLQVLMPTPGLDTGASDSESSRYLGAQDNSTTIGTRIPLCYGFVKIPGHILSFDVDTTTHQSDKELGSSSTVDTPLNQAKIALETMYDDLYEMQGPPRNLPDNNFVVLNLKQVISAKETEIADLEAAASQPGGSVGKSVFIEYDRTPVPKAILLPIYRSSTAGPRNIPTSGWSQA